MIKNKVAVSYNNRETSLRHVPMVAKFWMTINQKCQLKRGFALFQRTKTWNPAQMKEEASKPRAPTLLRQLMGLS